MGLPSKRNVPVKGHGALSNPPGRFERERREAIDDGWFQEEAPETLPTSIEPDRARSVISRNDSPDIPFEQSINPYRGCGTGCIYCYARPSHGYAGLSSGLDFERKLFFKLDAARVLEAELARPGYVCKPITLGANTDPYQPIERRMGVTRSVLEVLARCRHPVTVITKSVLVLKDIELLADLARDGLASVGVSITSLDAELKRRLEPLAASPQARLEVVRRLSDAGVATGVLVAPVIPAMTDHELEAILEAASSAGARWAGYVPLRLPYEVKNLFQEWLAAHYPDRAEHVMSLVRQMHGGRAYDARFGSRMRGTGPLAELLCRRFTIACRRLGLAASRRPQQSAALFRPPRPQRAQLRLELGAPGKESC